MKLDDLAVL